MKVFNVSHLYYTISSKRDGEGVFACSETLTKEEKGEIEKTVIVGYQAPLNTPFTPTDDEIKNSFPLNFAYYKLKNSRKQALLLSTYTGRCNHTPNRFGNFLTHVIFFTEPITEIKLPDLLEKLPFRKHLTIEEEQNFEIDNTVLKVDNNQLRNNLLKSSVSFLNENEIRKAIFEKVIDKIVDGWLKDSNHRIVFKGTKDDVKNFIFALYSILPSTLINQYSFATYKNTLKDSPFQIVGILSDANIKLLDNDLFFDLTQAIEFYESKNNFTKLVLESIHKDNLIDLEKYFSEYNLAEMNKYQLNNIIELINFKIKISKATLQELKEILNKETSELKKQELVDFVIQHNPNLFLEYLFEIIKEKVRYKYSVEEKINILFEYFKKYVNDNAALLQRFYKNIYLPLFQEEKETGKLAYFFFMKFEIRKILDEFAKEDELRLIDSYFKDNQNSEIDMKLKLFLEKYIGIIIEKVPFLYSKKVKQELLASIEKHTDNLNEISEKIQFLNNDNDRFYVIASYLYTLRKIGTFDLSFANYLPKIETFCDDKKNEFWKYFFSLKDEFRENIHSLSYLKRQFVIAILEKEDYQEIIPKLRFTSFEEEWLIDYFRERGETDKLNLFKKI